MTTNGPAHAAPSFRLQPCDLNAALSAVLTETAPNGSINLDPAIEGESPREGVSWQSASP